jgi:NADH-quinone oxidoreductase subunit G
MLELTLLNHPIDCPICDKAGECTLQKHYFDWDHRFARNDGGKVRKAKVVDVGPHIVLDQERCILCTRCIRVCNEVARAPDLTMALRGDRQVLTTAPGHKLDNPYSLNTVDVCPVGALTAKDFRFAMRAWELEATPSVCPGCATGCNIEVHASRGRIARLVPRPNPEVNRHWMCDEGRFTYHAVHEGRLLGPTVDGAPADWERALGEAARALGEAAGRPGEAAGRPGEAAGRPGEAAGRPGEAAGRPGEAAGRLGVVYSAGACNEDVLAVWELVAALGVEDGYLVGAAEGWSDDILVSADRNPNAAGVRAIAGVALRGRAELERDLARGKLAALLVLGDVEIRGATTIALAWHAEAAGKARVALPLAAWAEIDGSFTNRQGRVQRLHAAIPPAGQALAGWAIVERLGAAAGLALPPMAAAEQLFARACSRVAGMKGAEWGRSVPPLQLRFAASRG